MGKKYSYKDKHFSEKIYDGPSQFKLVTCFISQRVYISFNSDEERKRYRERSERIFKIWHEFNDSEIQGLLSVLTKTEKVDGSNIETVLTKLGTMSKLNEEVNWNEKKN